MKNSFTVKEPVFVAITLLFLGFSLKTYAQPGTLDVDFGSGGVVISPEMQTGFGDTPRAIAILPDNKIVTTGYSSTFDVYQAYISKYNTDGTPDAEFGSGGKVINTENYFTQYTDILAQQDGKIVVCGVKTQTFSSQGHDCFVARYNANGAPDNTFGNGGYFSTALSSSTDGILRILRLTDGRYICLARYGSGAAGIAALIMLTANGNLDPAFADNGLKTHLFSNTNPQGISDLALSTDGNILALGGGDGVVKMVKLDLNGNPVADFGTGGTVVVPTGRHIRVNQDGSVLVFGELSAGAVQMVTYKYLANGSVDSNFGSGGSSAYTSEGMGQFFNFTARPLLYTDGRYIRVWKQVTTVNGETKNKTALTWFDADGSLSAIGEKIHDISPNPAEFSNQVPEQAAMDANGDVFSFGYYQNATENRQFIMKFNGSPNLSSTSQYPEVDDLFIFPNPTSGRLYLNSRSDHQAILALEVRNSLGMLVYSSKDFETTGVINLTNMEPGMYFIHTVHNSRPTTFKVIKY